MSCRSKIGSAETVWSPPSRGFVKFNVDGSAKSDVAGCLGVMRTRSGVVTTMFVGPLPSFGSDYAEVMAINTAVEIFINANWIGKAGLIVESGSKVELNWILKPSKKSCSWWPMFLDIDGMVKRIEHVQKNLYASWLSNGMAD
ncbi:hypothetical protein GQ457_02G032010 [Hibiscus cannabinus]